ncbi:MAG: oligosaccharide flippase family protein [bacterium]|nr:oligosaccharide flippase family protein [bacterium]
MSPEIESFLKHGSVFFIGQLAIQGIMFFSIPIYTRFLSVEEYGIINLFTAAVSFFAILYGLQLYGSVGRYDLEKKKDFPEFLGTTFIMLFIAFIVEGGIFFIFKVQIAKFFEISSNVFLFVLFLCAFQVFFQIYANLLVVRKKSVNYAILSTVRALFLVGLPIPIMLLFNFNKYMAVIYGQIIGTIIVASYSIYRLLKETKWSFRLDFVKYSLNYNIPAIPGALAGFILNTFDRIIIAQLTTVEKTGLYSLAFNIGMVVNIFSGALFSAWAPLFIEKMDNKEYKNIVSITNICTDLMILGGICVSLFAKEIIFLMAPGQYQAATDIIPVIVLGYIFLYYSNLYSFHTSYRKEKIIFISLNVLIVGGIKLFLNYSLIPIYGYKIAAFTTAGLFLVLLFLQYWVARFLLKEDVIKLIPFFKKVAFALIFVIGVMSILKISNNLSPLARDVSFVNICIKILSICIWIYFSLSRSGILRFGRKFKKIA